MFYLYLRAGGQSAGEMPPPQVDKTVTPTPPPMDFRLLRFAGFLATLASTAFAQLTTTNLALEFNAGADPQGDLVWTDKVLGVEALAFANAPVRSPIEISGSNFPVLSVGYATPASGLNGYFDVGSPVRSTVGGTFELWVNVTSLTGGADQVIFEAGGADRGVSFILNNAALSFNVDGSLAADSTITTNLALGLHHLVGVITNTNNPTGPVDDSMSLYVNGALVQTLTGVRIDDWSGANPSGLGSAAGGSATGVTTPIAYHGQIAAFRYYSRALSAAQITTNSDFYRERIATYVTGQFSTNNWSITSDSGFTPTKTRTIQGVLYGFDVVKSNGSDGLAENQFVRIDLYSSSDGGGTWDLIKTIIDNTHPELTNTKFESIQLQLTPAGFVALYMKNLFAVTPAGATDNRKFLSCVFSETPTGNYTLAFNERPFNEPSGDLGIVTTGGQLYIVSANTTDGFINIFNVGSRGDSLVAHTLRQQWLLPDGSVDHREAPSVLFQGGYWVMTTSGRTGWRPNQHKYSYATSLAGPWAPLQTIGDATGYHSQLFFTSSAGNSSSRIFSATRNAPQWDGEGGSRPVWLPLRFNRVPDLLATNYYDEVVINYTRNTVEGFHYDRGRQLPISSTRIVGAADNIAAIADGDESTFWTNGGVTTKRTIELTLGSISQVKALKIKPYREATHTYKVKVFVGDGTNFTQVFPKDSEPPIIPNYAFMGPIDLTPAIGSVVRIENYATYNEGNLNNQFGLYEVQVWGGSSSAGTEVNEPFDAYPADWITSAQPGTTATAEVAPGSSSSALKLTDTSAANRVQVSKNFTGQNGSMVAIQWKYRTENAQSGEFLRLAQGNTTAFELVNSTTLTPAAGATTLAFTDNAGAETGLASVTVGEWHAFRLEVNTDTDTFDLYVDGQLAWLGGKLANPITRLDKLVLSSTAAGTGAVAYFDDVTVDGPNPAGSTSDQDQTDQLTQQVADLQAEIVSLQTTQTTLLTELTAANDDFEALNELYLAATARITSLDATVTDLTTRLTACEAALATAQTTILTLQGDLTVANETIATLTAEKAQLTAALAAALAEKQALAAQVVALSGSLAETSGRLTAAETALAEALATIQGLQSSLQQATTHVAALTAENERLAAELAASRDENVELTTQLTQTELALAATEVALDATQASLESATAQIAVLATERNQLAASLAAAQTANQSLAAQINAMTASLSAVTTLLRSEFNDPAFQLPGATPEAQLAALVQAINTLNRGQKEALYKAIIGK